MSLWLPSARISKMSMNSQLTSIDVTIILKCSSRALGLSIRIRRNIFESWFAWVPRCLADWDISGLGSPPQKARLLETKPKFPSSISKFVIFYSKKLNSLIEVRDVIFVSQSKPRIFRCFSWSIPTLLGLSTPWLKHGTQCTSCILPCKIAIPKSKGMTTVVTTQHIPPRRTSIEAVKKASPRNGW